jgi:integrase/recombinase XerD
VADGKASAVAVPRRHCGKPITRGAVEDACQKAHGICGIAKPITPHSLRHYVPFPTMSRGSRHSPCFRSLPACRNDIVLAPFNQPPLGKGVNVKYIINDQVVLSRPLEGPLAAYISSFGRWASEQGYGLWSLRRQVRLAACFSRWLGQRGVRLHVVSSEHAVQYLRYQARRMEIHKGDSAALRYLIEFLNRVGVIPAKTTATSQPSPVEQCAQKFECYLREERVLARATIINYMPHIRRFLNDRFGNGTVKMSRLCADDVVGFVQQQAPRLHPKRSKLMTAALRSFLQYARYCGEVITDLAAAVPVVPNWSRTELPRAITTEQVRQLLASINRRTAMGRRDYAILLLLARLGLRSSEVAFLDLDDIDWNLGQLSVRGKRGQRTELPLPTDVGKAIAAYLRRGRPESASRRVFLRAKAPLHGFQGPCGVGSIVRHSLKRAKVNAPTQGAHQFRHGLATEMLRQGASLGEIGEILGHRHPQTTTIYAKVDINALRTLALPWPGGAR